MVFTIVNDNNVLQHENSLLLFYSLVVPPFLILYSFFINILLPIPTQPFNYERQIARKTKTALSRNRPKGQSVPFGTESTTNIGTTGTDSNNVFTNHGVIKHFEPEFLNSSLKSFDFSAVIKRNPKLQVLPTSCGLQVLPIFAHSVTTCDNSKNDHFKQSTQNNDIITFPVTKQNANQQNKWIELLLHKGGFSTQVVKDLSELVSLQQMGSLVSTCRELNDADMKLYEPPTEWNDGDNVRRIFTIMMSTPKWHGRINTSKVKKMMLGVKHRSDCAKVAVVTDVILRFVASGKFPFLDSLDLSNCNNITDTGLLELWMGCPQLASVNLGYCSKITDASVIALSNGCPQLTDLNLWNCNITDASVIAISNGCPRLTSVDLYGCDKITDKSVIALSNGCQQLISLNLCDCSTITDKSVVALSNGCSLLVLLDLRGCENITDISVSSLANRCPQLTTFKLAECINITDASLIALSNRCQLTTLNLRYCNITDIGVIALSNECSQLTDLNLSDCDEITAASVIALSKGCPKLATLNLKLCHENITDESVVALSNGCSLLTDLNLTGCIHITDKSVIALANRCQQLVSLNLNDCSQITDESVFALSKGCPKLKKIDLSYCDNVTYNSVKTLSSRCPQLMHQYFAIGSKWIINGLVTHDGLVLNGKVATVVRVIPKVLADPSWEIQGSSLKIKVTIGIFTIIPRQIRPERLIKIGIDWEL